MRVVNILTLKEWTFDLLFPKHCAGCGSEGSFLCELCRPTLLFGTPSCLGCSKRNFDGVLCAGCAEATGIRRFLAPFSYRDPLARNLVHMYKYEGARELAELLSDELIAFLKFYAIRLPQSSVLVPIPLHRSRLARRGFNQAELLSEGIAKRSGIPVLRALRRTRRTEQQIEMRSHAERKSNVSGAFALRDQDAIRGKTVILVDDVSTSGATMTEAARVIREYGVRSVWGIAVAKG